MDKTRSVLDELAKHRIIPVLSIPSVETAAPLADALLAGGLPCAEITFRTPAAENAIRALANRGDLFVAAGTVLTIEQAKRAVGAGADCLLSPGCAPAVIEWANMNGVTMIPGVASPTDILIAMQMNICLLKFFPAQALGGVTMLNALTGPFADARFIPTGGIGPSNLVDYLARPNVIACGGSWMVKPEWLIEGDYESIRRATAQAVELAGVSNP